MKINYNNTIPEIVTATKSFWRRYALKRTVMLSLVFAILIGVMITRITMGQGIIAWILMGLSAGLLANLWLKPARKRKKLIQALNLMYQESYEVTFCDEAIEIRTLVQSEEEEEIAESKYGLNEEELFATEKQDMFLLYVNRTLIHVFPKRCMSEEQIEGLRNYFEEKVR
jgi:hypothetical protein